MRLRASAPASRRTPVAGLALLVALLLAACAGTTASQSPGASAPPASAGSGAPSSSDATGSGPKPTTWPGDIVEAVVNLGTADSQIQAAGNDLQAAAASQDVQKMWGAADGLVKLLELLPGQVDRLRGFPVTAAAVASWDAALPDMIAGAKGIRDSITAGDGPGVTAGFEQLAKGTTAYEATRKLMAPLVENAILMKRLLAR